MTKEGEVWKLYELIKKEKGLSTQHEGAQTRLAEDNNTARKRYPHTHIINIINRTFNLFFFIVFHFNKKKINTISHTFMSCKSVNIYYNTIMNRGIKLMSVALSEDRYRGAV